MKLSITPSAPTLLTFDSEFWSVPIAQADHPDVDRWAVDNTVGCIGLLLRTDEVERVHEAEAQGFRLMDVRVTLARETRAIASLGIRPCEPEDVKRVAKIARTAHRITRFYADPRFDNTRCDDLYEAWIRNSISGWADTVLVNGRLGQPEGYVTVHVDGGKSQLGLIAVDESSRRRGLGIALTLAAIDAAYRRGAKQMTVVTQARNIAALRTFERAAFRTSETHLWLHKWYTDA